jgi:hypothetical protein
VPSPELSASSVSNEQFQEPVQAPGAAPAAAPKPQPETAPQEAAAASTEPDPAVRAPAQESAAADAPQDGGKQEPESARAEPPESPADAKTLFKYRVTGTDLMLDERTIKEGTVIELEPERAAGIKALVKIDPQ